MPFEDFKPPHNTLYDLVFTSPPYFDLEIYNDDSDQSVSDNTRQERQWMDLFFSKYLSKAWSYLKPDKYFVININQKHKSEHYIKWMIDHMYKHHLDSHYFGVISYCNLDKRNPQPIFIWKKSTTRIPTELYNPKIIIKPIRFANKHFNIIRDDFLIGGSKQRALIPLLEKLIKTHNYQIFGYAGPVFGFGQIALAYGCKLLRRQCYIFVEKRRNLHNLTARAKSLGATIIEVPNKLGTNNTPLHDVEKYSQKYFQQHFNTTVNSDSEYDDQLDNKLAKESAYMIPFGMESSDFIKFYVNAIKNNTENSDLLARLNTPSNAPINLWLVAGSSVLLRALTIIFPLIHFNIVQVGRNIWTEHVDWSRSTLYVAPEKFYEEAIHQPPYPTVKTYDAKLWQFVMKHGRDGDYIWNVGRDLARI